MCARFAYRMSAGELAAWFGISVGSEFSPRYNVAPSQRVPVIRRGSAGPELAWLRWGLVPRWARPGSSAAKPGFINARSETVAEKPAFRDAFQKRRCLIPTSGFYEWQSIAGRKQPHWFEPAVSEPIAFAALWEPANPAIEPAASLDTVTILTVPANADVQPVHDRMPAILTRDQFACWLDASTTPSSLLIAAANYPEGWFHFYPVSRQLNRTDRDSPALLQPQSPQSLFDEGKSENYDES